jgi:ATP-dependent RNA helicase RhlB
MKFDELNLDEDILAGVAAAGFEECTEVQEKAIPHVINGSDVMVQSQTGTGKTAAFLLPAFQLLKNNPDYADAMAMVVAPTRELAVQIKEEADLLSEGFGIRTEVFHGGVGYGPQQKALAEGIDIIVATPGRMLDLSQSGHMNLKAVKIVVIDEADRLFDMGFYPDIRRMFQRLRPREERVNMLFSATLSTKARNIAWDHMNNPVEIEIAPEHITVDRVTQELYHVAAEDKMSVLLGILKQRKPRTAIVFTNTKRAAEEVSRRLEINGYPSEFIIGDLPQRKRQQIIQRIKSGEAEFLVATDVAARGLHINDLDMVVNYDIPEDPEAYVHRIGRTARAGESGQAVALACQRYVFGLEAIETLIRQRIPVAQLTEDLYAEDASAGMRIRTGDAGRDSRDRDRDRGRGGRGSSPRGPRERGSRDRDRDRDRDRSPRERSGARTPRPDRPDRSDRPRSGTQPARRPAEVGPAPKAGDSLEARLAYYRKKYGEDFQPTDEMLANMEGDGRSGGSGRSSGDGRSSGGSRQGRKRGGSRSRRPRSGEGNNSARGGADRQERPQSGGSSGSRAPRKPEPADRKERVPAPENAAARSAKNTAPEEPGKRKGLFGTLRSLFGGE